VPVRRAGVPGPQGGGVYLLQVQHTRLLDAALAVVAEEGVKRLSATRVSARAGMSTKTFYDLFAGREDCFLAVFDRAVEELAAVVGPAWDAGGMRGAGSVEDEWVERVRGALTVLLAVLEREPALGKVVFLEALGAGPRVLARRAEVLDRAADLLDQGRVGSSMAGVLPSLTAAGVAGAAFSVIHSRLSKDAQKPQELGSSLMELVGPVMATIVLPYRGREAASREFERPAPTLPELPALPEPAGSVDSSEGSEFSKGEVEGRAVDMPPLDSVEVRPTRRTYMVLASVAEFAGGNNREVGEAAGISDPAQISKLLARLRECGLVENRGGRTPGRAKAWWLTASGEEFLRAGLDDGSVLAQVRQARVVRRGRQAGVVQRGRPARTRRRAPRASQGAPRALQGAALVPRTDVAERRQALLLRAAVAMVDEHGYAGVTVAHIASRAKVSRRTFYELFEDREACLLAVLQDIDAQLTTELQAADLGGLEWRERIRIGLWMVLRFFDREPTLARFCVVESARGDDRMAAYRAGLLARVVGVFAAGGEERESVLRGERSPLVAEGLAGAVVSILSTRLASAGSASSSVWQGAGELRKDIAAGGVSDLFSELMWLIVLTYFGPELAREERTRPVPADTVPAPLPAPAPGSKQGGKYLALDTDPSSVPGLRMTYRTALVLEAIAQQPGISNLDVARHAQINDQGQVSKLLSRLERNGLVQNTGRGQTQGAPNEWRLTPAGQKLEQGIRERTRNNEKQAA
jgi:AcrR family transcriptional regulator/chromosome segregation and condensation protein ScpB